MKPYAARLGCLVVLLVIALASAGCLVKASSATVCLEPDGSARWTVLEKNVHATGDTPADRLHEEEAFMAAVAADNHANAAAFRSLGGTDIRTDVVSSSWPFAVLTEARFPNIAVVCQQILDRIDEAHGQSVLERSGNRVTWRITVEADPDDDQPKSNDTDDVSTSLFGDDGPVFFMRHGQFVDGVGFDITDDGRVAKMADLDKHDWTKEPKLVLSLTWVPAEAVNAVTK